MILRMSLTRMSGGPGTRLLLMAGPYLHQQICHPHRTQQLYEQYDPAGHVSDECKWQCCQRIGDKYLAAIGVGRESC